MKVFLGIDTSAYTTSLAAVEYTATVGMFNSRQARIIRTAISPRLAIKTLLNNSHHP
jgi:hypothetical protein